MKVASCIAVLLASLALAACSPQSAQPPQSATTPPAGGTATAPSSTASASAEVALGDIELRLVPVARGFEQPLWVTNAGDGSGRLFVVEQTGRVKVVRDGRVLARPYLDLSGEISSGGERGLLGLAFAPDFETSGNLYVDYTDRNGDTVVERHTADDPASDSPTFQEPDPIFTQKQPFANHNGGCIIFAPDGTLWVGMGDGGSAGDPGDRAQNSKIMLGKMLSLDVSTGAPPSPTVVMKGLRNPWRYSFDRENSDVWIGDVGQNAWEEIDYTPFADAAGRNWGWNRWEGNHAYPSGATNSRDGFSFPVIEYSSKVGNSVTGGYVYRGSAYPKLEGVYLYGDFVRGWIAIARRSADGRVEHRTVLKDSGVTPASFGESEDGELYLCDYNGRLLQITTR